MSKRYFLFLAISVVFITVILATRTPEVKQTQLLERNAELSSLAEWSNTRDAVRNLQLQLKSKPSDIKIKLAYKHSRINTLTLFRPSIR